MAEKLLPLDLPPGLFHNGTKYQAKNRWYDGNLVRFFQKTIQPVGGWVQRTLTGAAIGGVPNAVLAWTLNDGRTFLAVGTTTGLYVVDPSNVVTNILPSDTRPSAPWQWRFAAFGSLLIAVIDSRDTSVMNTYAWTPGTGAATILHIDDIGQPAGSHNQPTAVSAVVTTGERFLVLLRGGNLRDDNDVFASPGRDIIAD